MARIVTAKKNHGRCALCPKQIKPGDEYVIMMRHATRKQIEDPKIYTFSPFAGKGPMVQYKFHATHTPEEIRKVIVSY